MRGAGRPGAGAAGRAGWGGAGPTLTSAPSTVDGHSSSEDASACMHLVIWKIREDAKTKR